MSDERNNTHKAFMSSDMMKAQEPELMQRANAMGLNWTSLKDAVVKFGPVLLDDAQELVTKGLSVATVTALIQDAAKAFATASGVQMAALQPGVKGSWLTLILPKLIELAGPLIQNAIKNTDLSKLLSDWLTSIFSGKAPAAAMTDDSEGPPALA